MTLTQLAGEIQRPALGAMNGERSMPSGMTLTRSRWRCKQRERVSYNGLVAMIWAAWR